MKVIQRVLPSNIGPQVKIIPFSDLHIGSAKCNLTLIKEQVKKVKDDPNTYAIIVGDLINNSTKTSVGDVYSEPIPPMKQIEMAVDIFEPIKDKILAITAGNHERRSYKTDGVDLVAFFALELGLQKCYDYVAPMLFLSVGGATKHHSGAKTCYSIYITHGDGSNGRTIGGKANSLGKRGGVCCSDIIITGHTHEALTFREVINFADCNHKAIVQKETVFVNCGATLDYEEYAELYGMRPSSLVQPEIILSCKEKGIKVIL